MTAGFAIRHLTRFIPGRPVSRAGRRQRFQVRISNLIAEAHDPAVMLRVESCRLLSMSRRCGSPMIGMLGGSLELAAAWLDSLGAPEKTIRYQKVRPRRGR